MFHEFLSFVVDNQIIYVRFHHGVFQLVILIDVLVKIFAIFPKTEIPVEINILKSTSQHFSYLINRITLSYLLTSFSTKVILNILFVVVLQNISSVEFQLIVLVDVLCIIHDYLLLNQVSKEDF